MYCKVRWWVGFGWERRSLSLCLLFSYDQPRYAQSEGRKRMTRWRRIKLVAAASLEGWMRSNRGKASVLESGNLESRFLGQ